MSRKNARLGNPPANRRNGRLRVILGGAAMVTISLVIRYYWGAESASADSPAGPRSAARARTTKAKTTKASPSGDSSKPQVVAVVNRERISRDELGRECLRHYGETILESLINKYLISEECKRRNIVITRNDVNVEIERMAKRFSLPTDQWLKMLKEERGIGAEQYAGDIIWPMLALRRLAGDQMVVSDEELAKQYETMYGPAIDARLIACISIETAQEVHAKAIAKPDDFPKLAQQYSVDAASASAGGRIQPIRMHGSYPEIEQAAFNMEDGEVSKVISVGGQHVIIQRQRELPGAKTISFERVAVQLEKSIRAKKMRSASNEIFKQLQDRSQVVNILNDPVKRRQMPGIAALVNNRKVTIAYLSEACIERHGIDVLDGTINRKLIEQACAQRKITIGETDLDEEITRAASVSVEPKDDGSPDVEAWLRLITKKQGVSVEVYRSDAVWPTVALKKLVADRVKVDEDDLAKGFEANYGPRVRCMAIVLNDLRRAQRVWGMARDRRTAEYFGELAAEYSAESGSRALRGKVPPIRKHGGQPVLEREAFVLKPGEISGIIQANDQFVILFCEGYTKPDDVDRNTVRQYIFEDVYEKKQRGEMAKYFQKLQDTAVIDNYLAGTSQWPQKETAAKSVAPVTSLRRVSGG